jgi:hypothetical protein
MATQIRAKSTLAWDGLVDSETHIWNMHDWNSRKPSSTARRLYRQFQRLVSKEKHYTSVQQYMDANLNVKQQFRSMMLKPSDYAGGSGMAMCPHIHHALFNRWRSLDDLCQMRGGDDPDLVTPKQEWREHGSKKPGCSQ